MASDLRVMINAGCGASPTHGWVNYDNSLTVRLAQFPTVLSILSSTRFLSPSQRAFGNVVAENGVKWADVTKKVPWPDNSVDVVYSSHMFEHLDRPAARRFLEEVKRVLVPDGVLRLAVPDIAIQVSKYISTGDADGFVAGTLLACPKPETMLEKLRWLVVGGRHHAWMYDEHSLVALLAQVGFHSPKRLAAGETTIPNPRNLDLREREEESLYVEAAKPSALESNAPRSAGLLKHENSFSQRPAPEASDHQHGRV